MKENNEEEKKIGKLFLDLKRADECLASPFAKAWGAALSRMGQVRQPRQIFRVAIAVAMLMVVVGSGIVFYRAQSPIPFSHLAWGIASGGLRSGNEAWFDQQVGRSKMGDERRFP